MPKSLANNADTRRLIRAEARLLLASDAGLSSRDVTTLPPFRDVRFLTGEDRYNELGKGHFLWLQVVSEMGMEPTDALLAATSNIARAYKIDKNLGTLEKGKITDLIILYADPLANPENYKKIYRVIKVGKIVDRERLPIFPQFSCTTGTTCPLIR